MRRLPQLKGCLFNRTRVDGRLVEKVSVARKGYLIEEALTHDGDTHDVLLFALVVEHTLVLVVVVVGTESP